MSEPASGDEIISENDVAPNNGVGSVPAPETDGMLDGAGVPVPGYSFPGDLLRP